MPVVPVAVLVAAALRVPLVYALQLEVGAAAPEVVAHKPAVPARVRMLAEVRVLTRVLVEMRVLAEGLRSSQAA